MDGRTDVLVHITPKKANPTEVQKIVEIVALKEQDRWSSRYVFEYGFESPTDLRIKFKSKADAEASIRYLTVGLNNAMYLIDGDEDRFFRGIDFAADPSDRFTIKFKHVGGPLDPLAAPSNGASGGSEVASAAPAVGGRLIGGSTYVGSRVSVIIPLQTSQRQQGARGGAEPKPVPTRDRTTMSRPQWSGRAGMRKKTSG